MALTGSFVRQPQIHWSCSSVDSFSRVATQVVSSLSGLDPGHLSALIGSSKHHKIGSVRVRRLWQCSCS